MKGRRCSAADQIHEPNTTGDPNEEDVNDVCRARRAVRRGYARVRS